MNNINDYMERLARDIEHAYRCGFNNSCKWVSPEPACPYIIAPYRAAFCLGYEEKRYRDTIIPSLMKTAQRRLRRIVSDSIIIEELRQEIIHLQ